MHDGVEVALPHPTLREIGQRWTRGDLARQYPDPINQKRTAEHDAGRLKFYIYPLVSEVPIDRFTLDHAEAVMRALPAKRAPATLRQVAQLRHRICNVAVSPPGSSHETPSHPVPTKTPRSSPPPPSPPQPPTS